jgi:hypothetical protein
VGLFSRSSTDEPVQAPTVTLNGARQNAPEVSGMLPRRNRLFVECLRRTRQLEVSQQDASGVPLGDGTGLEAVVETIRPVFSRDASLVQWVALRGALTSLYIDTLDPESRSVPFFPVVEVAMGVGHVGDVQRGDDSLGVAPAWVPQLSADQISAAVGIFAVVQLRLYRYEEYLEMPLAAVLADPSLRMNDAIALDVIAWATVAMHRLGLGHQLQRDAPEPDLLEAPGWYTEPLWSKGERFWDGRDWTSRVRGKVDNRSYAYTEMALR